MEQRPRGHHFIPQFLLRRFASRQTRKSAYAFLFRKGSPPFECNIADIAKERDFHDDSRTSTLESDLAARESEFAGLVRRIEENGCIPPADVLATCEFVVNLFTRTRHIRREFAERGTEFLQQVDVLLRSTDAKTTLCQMAMQRSAEAVRSNRFDELPRPLRDAMLCELEAVDFEPFLKRATALFSAAASKFDTHAVTKQAQNANLLKPSQWVNVLSRFNWTAIPFNKHSLVLGDVVVVGLDARGNSAHPVVFGGEKLEGIYLPLGDGLLLRGWRGNAAEGSEASANWLNQASVELSREFFVASMHDNAEGSLVSHLGLRAALISKAEIAILLEESLRRLTDG